MIVFIRTWRNITKMEIKINERPSSATIKISTTGKWSGEVKEYADNTAEATALAIDSANTLEIYLNEQNKKRE